MRFILNSISLKSAQFNGKPKYFPTPKAQTGMLRTGQYLYIELGALFGGNILLFMQC